MGFGGVVRGRGFTGPDRFVFDPDDGNDTITDFEDGLDLLEVTGGLSFSDVTLTQNGSDLDVSFGSTTVRLVGISQSDIDASDFLFS